MRLPLGLLLSAWLVAGPVSATPITRTFEVSATDWFLDPPTPPTDPLLVSFTVAFDPMGSAVIDQSSGLTLNSVNVALDSAFVFTYFPTTAPLDADALFVGGVATGAGTVNPGENDFAVRIDHASTGAPAFSVALYSTASPAAFWRSETGTLRLVPEPTTTALLTMGLLGAGYARRRRAH